MSRLLRSAVLTVALAATAAVTTPVYAADGPSGRAQAQQGVGIRLLDASVERRDDPRAHIYINDHLKPGTSITRHIEVSDFTNEPMSLRLYAVASSIDGAGWQVSDGTAQNELTSWIRVTPATVDLDPGESARATVQIDVPVDAAEGERYATIVAELPPPPRSAGETVRVASRVGVRVYLDIGPGGEPASDFTISTLTAARTEDGTPIVSAKVTNTGGRALDLGGRLTLADGPGGLRAGPFDVQVPRTLGIGDTGDVVVPLDKQTPAGPWQAKLTLRSGFTEHTMTGRITFPDKAGAAAKPVKAVPFTQNRNILVPIAVGLIVGLVIGLVLFLLWRRRRKDDEDEDDRAGTPSPPRVPAQRRAERDVARRQ